MSNAQSAIKIIQCQIEVNLSNGTIDNPNTIVTTPIPLPSTIDGTNHFKSIFKVPATITKASSGKTGNIIIRGK